MKPANVMLQPDGQIKMIDFGTARTEKVGVAMQADTICIGTAGFAAPEQFGGIGQSTARTDIFCLGATLYNLITGHSPCEWPTGILPLSRWNVALADSPLDEIIAKCTRNDPNERYQTALELREDLASAASGTYRCHTKKSVTGMLWQRQDFSTRGLIENSLSGLLQKGKTEKPLTPNKNQHTQATNGWQQPMPKCAAMEQAAKPVINESENEHSSLIQKLLLIFILVAVIFLVLTVVLVLCRLITAAIVFLLIGIMSATASVVCLLKSRQ